jgi:hypothetical protein
MAEVHEHPERGISRESVDDAVPVSAIGGRTRLPVLSTLPVDVPSLAGAAKVRSGPVACYCQMGVLPAVTSHDEAYPLSIASAAMRTAIHHPAAEDECELRRLMIVHDLVTRRVM